MRCVVLTITSRSQPTRLLTMSQVEKDAFVRLIMVKTYLKILENVLLCWCKINEGRFGLAGTVVPLYIELMIG